MSEREAFLSANELLFATRDTLLSAGYAEITNDENDPGIAIRAYENPYNYVTVAAFETWSDLRNSWAAYQASTAEAMTKRLKRDDPKAWDGYLVLLTPSPIPLDQAATANEIRSNVLRLRKLLGTGDEIKTLSDVRRVLLPLLPMTITVTQTSDSGGLDALPRILERRGIPAGATETIVRAFKAQEQLLPKLHEFRTTE